MISDEMRKRIAALNRRDLKHDVETGDEEGTTKPEKPPRASGKKRDPIADVPAIEPTDLQIVATAADARLRLTLKEVAPGEEVGNKAGQFLLIEQSIQSLLHGGGGGFQARYELAIGALTAGLGDESFGKLSQVCPEEVIYVDIETTGLTAGTPLFLVGVLGYVNGSLCVQQLLARDYTEEPALLMHFSDMIKTSQIVVSFNGRSYDLPYIRDRSVFMGVPFQFHQAHIDMLHVARRRWKRRLPNCKLQTLEQYICKRVRRGDIPGAEIPDAYHRFVKTGNAVQMRDILHHNALDLLTTAEVLTFVLEGRDL
jgi:uncharacterized protein YprB with RNaseH-like and TPR domain